MASLFLVKYLMTGLQQKFSILYYCSTRIMVPSIELADEFLRLSYVEMSCNDFQIVYGVGVLSTKRFFFLPFSYVICIRTF